MRMESQLEKRPPITLRLPATGIPRWLALALIALATVAPAQLTWLHGLAGHNPAAACDHDHSHHHDHHHDHDDHEPAQSPDHCLLCVQLLALTASVAPPPPATAPAPPTLVSHAPRPPALAHDSVLIHTLRARGPPPARSATIPV